jgi:nucleoside-diphosphate-sugar epimerase
MTVDNPTMKVAIVGATGETGRSVVNGLLAADYDFVRPSRLSFHVFRSLALGDHSSDPPLLA